MVTFIGSQSFASSSFPNPNSTALATYNWDFDSSDGISNDADGATVSHSFSQKGIYDVSLTVTDSLGHSHMNSVSINIGSMWQEVGPPIGCDWPADLEFINGSATVACAEIYDGSTEALIVKQFDGDDWVQLGEHIYIAEAFYPDKLKLCYDQNNLMLAFIAKAANDDQELRIASYNGSSWRFLGSDPVIESTWGYFHHMDFTCHALSAPTVIYWAPNFISDPAYVKQYISGAWYTIGDSMMGSYVPEAFALTSSPFGEPLLTYADYSDTYRVNVLYYDSTNLDESDATSGDGWAFYMDGYSLGPNAPRNYATKLAVTVGFTGHPWFAYEHSGTSLQNVVTHDGGQWKVMAEDVGMHTDWNGLEIVVDSNNYSYVYDDSLALMHFDGTTWFPLGRGTFNRNLAGALAIDGNVPYVLGYVGSYPDSYMCLIGYSE